MKFVNFNQFRQDGSWVNTWKAWNKQYLQPLNAKITSLQDYVVYNCPEYVIFNSPYNENPIDITEKSIPLQEDITWGEKGKEQYISLFFPARLSWHQGFYNQSEYGDGVLMYKKGDNLYQSYNHINMPTIQHYIFQEKEDIVTPIDINLNNYSLYVLLSSKAGTYINQITPSEFFYNKETDTYVATRSIFIGESDAKNITILNFKGPGDNWEHSYDTTTGFLNIINTRWMEKPGGSISFSFDYEIKSSAPGLKRLWHNGNSENFISAAIDTYIDSKTFMCVQYLLNPLYLIHHSNIDYYEAIGFLQYNTTNNTLQIEQIVPKGLVYLNTDSNLDINQTSDITLTITSLPSSLNQFTDFPSGYICILNKQPIGINNETNSIKKSLDSYLIAPIGNSAYYMFNFLGNNLIAKHTLNNLNNFINKIQINLGQNLRYSIKNPVYIMGAHSFDGKGGSFSLPNIGVNNNEVTNIITDHVDNLWTGGAELIGQTVCHSTKEEVFMDIMYDTYTSQLERYIIHNFNISTTEDIADIKEDDKITSMIQLQLF